MAPSGRLYYGWIVVGVLFLLLPFHWAYNLTLIAKVIGAGLLMFWYLRLRDRWEDVWRSLVQLVLGTYMVWDAHRLRLCATYFERQEPTRHVTPSA